MSKTTAWGEMIITDIVSSKSVTLTTSSSIFKSSDNGITYSPNIIKITPIFQGDVVYDKYQYSLDGGESYQDVYSGTHGFTISKDVLIIGKNCDLFDDKIASITLKIITNDSDIFATTTISRLSDVTDIGDGRNLLWNSNFAKTDEAITNGNFNSWGLHVRNKNITATIDTSVTHNGFNTLKAISAADGETNGGNDLEWLVKGISEVNNTKDNLFLKEENYTLSFYAKASVATDFIVRWGYDIWGSDTTRSLATDWKRYEIKLHASKTSYARCVIFKLLKASTVWFSEFKLEKGSSATGYSTAPEDVQTAILSTKSEISDVSLEVDKNKKSIEGKVENTTYQNDLKLVKGDISKANEGLNKWRYEIYPKSLFTTKTEDQSKSTLDVFARNKNLVPSQSLLLDDTKLGQANYDDNYIGYAVTFIKMSEATKLETTFVHDDGGSFYVNGKLICTNGKNNFYNSATPDTVSCTLVKGWNCLEVVINEGAESEGFKFGAILSQLSTCELMNCYYAMVTGRESQITNTLVQNTINIDGVSTRVGKVTSVLGEDGENFTDFKNDYSDFKQTMNGFQTTVSSTYVTKSDFDDLEIGGRNLLLNSAFKNNNKEWTNWGSPATREIVASNDKMWAHIVGNKKLYQGFNQVRYKCISIGDKITFSAKVKGGAANQKFTVGIHWRNDSGTTLSQSWNSFTVGITEQICKVTYESKGTGFNLMIGVSDESTAYDVYFTEVKFEKSNKATDWTPAPEDDEINGQNLVSNLPANWEQGSVQYNAGSLYSGIKTVLASHLRTKDVFSVSGNVTVSAGTSTNSSKEELNFYYVLFDVNKKAISSSSGWQSLTSAKTINCDDAKYMAIILRWGSGTTTMNPSDISQICLKIERGTSATPFTLAPEDVNGKIVNVETIANQTAKKFEWIVKGGDKSSSMVLTDDFLNIVANKINLKGKVTFESFDQSLKDNISNASGNLITITPTNPKSDYDGVAYATETADKGEKCIKWTTANQPYIIFTAHYTPNIFRASDRLYYDLVVPNWSSTITVPLGVWFYDKNKTYLSKQTVSVTLTGGQWNHITGYIDMPAAGSSWNNIYYYNLGIENTSKAIIGLCSSSYIEKTTSYATTYASSAVNWVTNNGQKTQNLYSMVSNWAADAISDTTEINGGLIKSNTILSRHIVANAITGDKILAGSITADKIDVTDLFAQDITVSGVIRSANYDLDASGNIAHGSAWYLQDNIFKSKYLNWDSEGNLYSTSGTIGGWKITNDGLYSADDSISINSSGSIMVGGSSSSIRIRSGVIECYNGGNNTRLGSICTVDHSSENTLMFGIASDYNRGWGLYHYKQSTDTALTPDMYLRPSSGAILMPRGYNISYTDDSHGGTDGYFRIARIWVTGTYVNCPVEFTIIRRGDISPTRIVIALANSSSAKTSIRTFFYESHSNMEIYACDGATSDNQSVIDVYVRKSEGYDNITLVDMKNSWGYQSQGFHLDTTMEFYSSKPAVTHQAENLLDSGWITCNVASGLSAYDTNGTPKVRRKNGIVYLQGCLRNSSAFSEWDNFITFRSDFAPERTCEFIMQGSNLNRWLLEVRSDGTCKFHRYGTTSATNVGAGSWLNIYASWVAKD